MIYIYIIYIYIIYIYSIYIYTSYHIYIYINHIYIYIIYVYIYMYIYIYLFAGRKVAASGTVGPALAQALGVTGKGDPERPVADGRMDAPWMALGRGQGFCNYSEILKMQTQVATVYNSAGFNLSWLRGACECSGFRLCTSQSPLAQNPYASQDLRRLTPIS